MPRNPEENEKCQEKLSQMQKFLPFLDFMIEKIKKKNEVSLECQLNKFQVLRSMISEKNKKYTWDALIKVEQIIEKLISKLEYKEDLKKSKISSELKDIKSIKYKMSASVSRPPSASSGDSIRNEVEDPRNKNVSSNAIDKVMKSLKISAGNTNSKNLNVDKDTVQPFEEKTKNDVTRKLLGTDLDKDLDGFDLTDCSNTPEGNFKCTISNVIGPEKASSQEDLLSSSREKLLKSLQNRLFSNRMEHTSSHFSSNKSNHSFSGEVSVKSFNTDNSCENKYGSSEVNEPNVSNANITKNRIPEKPHSVSSKTTKTSGMLEKQRSESECSELNLKQKLKEKLSTDICEVYKVPGRSVGGSLRCLKDSRDHKKSNFLEDEELFKPDKLIKINVPSRGSSSNLQPVEAKDKSRKDSKSSEFKVEKNSDKTSQTISGGVKNKQDDRNFKHSEFKNIKSNTSLDKKTSNKYDKKDVNKLPEKEEKTEKRFEMDKLNDDELTEFVKENIQHLPHLAKLKPAELRKTVELPFKDPVILSDAEILSDDSLQEFDEFLSNTNRSPNELKLTTLSPKTINKNRERHPLASLKIAEVGAGADSAPKNIKQSTKSNSELKVVEGAGENVQDTNFVSPAESVDEEEEYAIKLIEETTLKNVSVKKKKGLLDLPLPETNDLFDDITSIESFESSNNSNEIRDPRLKKLMTQPESEKKLNKSDSTSQLSQNDFQLLSFESKPHEGFPLASISTENLSGVQRNEPRLDERVSTVAHHPEDPERCTDKYSKELKNCYSKACANSCFSNDTKLQTQNSSAPKSYAEYKRMKRKEQGKLGNCETATRETILKCNDDSILENSHLFSDKDIVKPSLIKDSKSCPFRHDNSNSKNSWCRSESSNRSRNKKKLESQRSSQSELQLHNDSQEENKRRENEKTKVVKSEELISPLEKLYQSENKPKTGRGYGIQYFKIPKKVQNSNSKSNRNKTLVKKVNDIVKNDPQPQFSSQQNELDLLKSNLDSNSINDPVKTALEGEKTELSLMTVEPKKKPKEEAQEVVKSINKSINSENKEDLNNFVVAEINRKSDDKINFHIVSDSKIDDQFKSEVELEIDSGIKPLTICEPTQNIKSNVGEKSMENLNLKLSVVESAKKYEPEVVECDSSVENSALNDAMSTKITGIPSEKNTVISKEEITQEFVEALIRKSFESGQGKLLLAQAKLFEELGRKLNSKKLKTIQKIINSESDSTSSSSESSSNEKKKKKSKKSKKLKKKVKKNKRLVISSTSGSSSSSSSTESEESEEEKNTKKKKQDILEALDKMDNNILLEGIDTKKNDVTCKSKSITKKKKRLDYPSYFSRKRSKRKQHQNKLIEKILNETPVNSEEASAKELEPKVKPKPKAKLKTELDKLHEDIKNMFISSGVVTATGQRMCRILRNSGGKMDNVDIVKESAKMVEEEKLKKVQTLLRSGRPRNTTRRDSRSRSQSLDKSLDRSNDKNYTENEYNQDPKLRSKPHVLLQKVDLNNFGYGVKISDDCISFSRKKGRNTAIRGLKSFCKSFTSKQPLESPSRKLSKGVFLARNKRKCERLNGKICKTRYIGKKLVDVVRNLPLKMAKMKHLQFCEKKNDDARKKKMIPKKLERKMARFEETKQFSDQDLVDHAFQLRKTCYRCKVCSQNFKNITEHYKTVHPEYGVLISRLCQKQATRAKSDALKNNYEGEMNSLKDSCKRKGSFSYQCRMCRSAKTDDVNSFFTHVTTHTGELRFQCPNENCNLQTANGEEIKFHILTKHPKSRYDLYNKIIELYPSPIEGSQLFGFLCSKCNFVQLSHSNLRNHVSKQHPSEHVKIFKINMSSYTPKRLKIKRMMMKKCTKNSAQFLRCKSTEPIKKKNKDVAQVDVISLDNGDSQITDDDKLNYTEPEEDESDNEDIASSSSKNFFRKSEKEVVESDEDSQVLDVEDETQNESALVEVQEDIKIAFDVQENATEDQLETKDRIIDTLEVGPLKALLPENSEVYFKCRVQNCGIFRKGFEKFEQHLIFKHNREKWDGMCQICSLKVSNGLLSALKHLKFHILNIKRAGLTENSELKMMESLSKEVLIHSNEISCEKGVKNIDNAGVPYPVKPLLKVRSLQGDRLSTPKECADESEIITITEEASQSNKMFTIENVRSLKSVIEPDTSDINTQQVCVLNEQHPAGSQAASGKVILVRSCPTRKIAIRPENSSLSLDVGQFSLVQTPVATHPTMHSPTGTPIHLLSPLQSSAQNHRIAIKPVVVTNNATFKGNSTTMPVIGPGSISASVLPLNASSETNETLQVLTSNESSEGSRLIKSKHPVEITVSMSPSDPKSPTAALQMKTFSEISNLEDQEEKELINPLKVFTSIGNKTVKDATIYKQMLTKSKLCHLFKCMAVECSFTCNKEEIFTRHIGLHEAQRRLKKKKGVKEDFSLSKKLNKTSQWKQCAYCCQVLYYTDNALSLHILSQHGHCTYQCAYCFYRAICQNYVEIHQNIAHKQILKTGSRVIYRCKPLGSSSSKPAVLEKRGRKQSVRPYICDQCGKNFYIMQEFLTHLTTEHQGVTAYTCHICKNLCFKANRLINHYKLHSYCTYQCAYCLHGTETEVEMVFHLCNFHFSQPALMYHRAVPEGIESEDITQLESLKVVVYENDSLSEDCIVEADLESEEESTYDPLKESIDLSEIVAELGINSDDQSECEVTPLLKELASLSDRNAKDVTVKTLLPNAQFSSENDNMNEGCSVLISSGVSVASAQNDGKDMSIPLGQLPLEALNIKYVQPVIAETPKKSPKINEAGFNLQTKETSESVINEENEETSEPLPTPCVHNMPQVLITKTSSAQKIHSLRRLTITKRTAEDLSLENAKSLEENGSALCEVSNSENEGGAQCSKNKFDSVSNGQNEDSGPLNEDTSEKNPGEVESTQPLITSVVSLSKTDFVNENNEGIGDLEEQDNNINVSKIVINIRSDVNPPPSIKPTVKSIENFPTDDSSMSLDANPELVIDEAFVEKDNSEETYPSPKSPDIVILEEEKRNKNIETVTLDSDDEKDLDKISKNSNIATETSVANGEIGNEMEVLRHQMTNETDSLLFENAKKNKARADFKIALLQNKSFEDGQPKDILSPIEEAICSLNKKLQSETTKTQDESTSDSNGRKNNLDDTESDKPRTRFGSRDKRKEMTEEKNGEEESKKEESCKNKKVRKELVGKELFICGNEQCTFAAENNSSLKDHLYVCDFSRVSSVLMCPHCTKHFKQFSPYLEHLKYHGEKKFHCGLCSFSSAVESATVRHVKQKHKCHITKSIPKDPPKEDHLIFYPKNHKIDKIDFEENGYSPGDENKLPLQSVYQVNVKCAKCPYFTKVRSNMVRHLKIHMKSAETEGVIVPSTAPTNPVPCLETKEKMFDKMTNLAASSQLAQAEKEKFIALPPQMEAKFPQFISEQFRFKCSLSDCNYITVDDRMLKHHIKALHNEVSHYSCPHCRSTVHVDIRNVSLEKIGHHLKFHDSKLYKCGLCFYIHYQKNLVEKHSYEKHSDRRCIVQTIRDLGAPSEEEQHSGSEGDAIVFKCARCENFQSVSKSKIKDHLLNDHKTKASHQCQHCSMTGSGLKAFANHFASKHPGEKVAFFPLIYEQKIPSSKLSALPGNSSSADSSNEHFDTTPLWQRGAPRIRHIRGILIEEEEVKTKKSKRSSVEDPDTEINEPVPPKNKVFYCPLCGDKKKVFFTKNEDCFRTHLYQELNYQQFACILCGKMFVDKKDFDKHHARMHPDKPPEMNQTKEDGEIIFWVDKVIAKQREQIKEKKRKLSETESNGSSSPSKKKKES